VKRSDHLSNSNDIDNIHFENVILVASNYAKELISDLNIAILLKKFNAFQFDGLSRSTRNTIQKMIRYVISIYR